MSSEPLFRELDIALRPSAYLTAILAMAHLGALGCVLVLPWDWAVRALLAVPVCLGLLMNLPAVTSTPSRVVTRFRWSRDGLWVVWDGTGRPGQTQAGRGLLVHPWMTILDFRHRGGRRSRFVVILPDSADPDLRRRLNVRLRMEGLRA